jgi:hypothetical protein
MKLRVGLCIGFVYVTDNLFRAKSRGRTGVPVLKQTGQIEAQMGGISLYTNLQPRRQGCQQALFRQLENQLCGLTSLPTGSNIEY